MAKRQTRNTTPAPVATEVVDLAPDVRDELSLTEAAGQAIRAFLVNLAVFFRQAKDLEVRSERTLMAARTLKAPTSGTEDAALQRFIQRTTAERKEVEEHWHITTVVHNLHRRLTGRRKKSTDALEQAGAIAQQLHNRYVEAERRRAAEEEARLRREAEERARQQREAELAKLELDAIAAEEASANLSERELRFVEFILEGITPTQAAYRAGYKDTTRGPRMLEQAKIADAIEMATQARTLRQQAKAVEAMPLDVDDDALEVRPDIQREGVDRTTWSAELLDEQALIDAVCDGRHGIPRDVLQVNGPALNRYARDMKRLIDRWPGVRAKSSTRTV